MHRIFSLLLAALAITFNLSAQQSNFEIFWKEIDEAMEQGLPETALQKLTPLRAEAIARGDLAQEVKAKLYELRIKAEKDPKLTGRLLADAEKFTVQLKASAEKGLMYLMLAESYSNYLNKHSYRLRERSGLLASGAISKNPESIEEWSKADLLLKMNQLIECALEDTILLQQRRISSTDVFIVTDTLQFQQATTLYDLMLIKTSEIVHIDEESNPEYWLRRHLNYRRTQPEIFPLVMAEIQLYRKSFQAISFEKERIAALDSLIAIYQSYPEVVELMAEKASLLFSQSDKKQAHALCTEGLSRFPDYARIQLLDNIRKQVEAKNLHLKAESHYPSKDSILFTLNATNTSRVNLKLYRIYASALEYQQHLYNQVNKFNAKRFPKVTLVDSLNADFLLNPDFKAQTRKLSFSALSYGLYEIRASVPELSNDSTNAVVSFVVTDLLGLRRPLNSDSILIYAVDAQTGKPIRQVKATVYDRRWDNSGQYLLRQAGQAISDKNGRMVIGGLSKHYNTTTLLLQKGEDQYCWLEYYNQGFPVDRNDKQQAAKYIQFFTDRSIYRPGQVVHFKAIAYRSDAEKELALADTLLTIALFDTNGSQLSSQLLRTNRFGSVAGSFVLPASGLNGTYTLRSGNQFQHFKVEEYKRPTFEVNLKTETKEIRFGKKVQFSGKAMAFAGFPVARAKINYTIYRKVLNIYRFRPGMPFRGQVVEKGATTTDFYGNFAISFIPEKDAENKFLEFELQVDVTSAQGETQQGVTSFILGEHSLLLYSSVASLHEKSKVLKPNVNLQDLNRNPLNKTVFYELHYVPSNRKTEEPMVDASEWSSGSTLQSTTKLILKNHFSSYDSLNIEVQDLPSGKYILRLHTLDEAGDTVKAENRFILYSAKEKKPAVYSQAWLPVTEFIAAPGSEVEIPFGTSLRNAWILYEINDGTTIVKQQWVRQCNTIKNYTIKLEERFKEGLTIRFTLVQMGRIVEKQAIIKSPVKVKELKPVITTFRDKLRPGAKEEWTVSVSGQSHISTVELLAGMYDASLDQFAPLQWQFTPAYKGYLKRTVGWMQSYWYWSNDRWNYQDELKNETLYSKADINFYGAPSALAFGENQIYIRGGAFGRNKMVAASSPVQEEVVFSIVEDAGKMEAASLPIRQNFNETAFFYPQLQAGPSGLFSIGFTLPESLTRWKLKLLAHSSDLYSGQSEYTIISQKELMVSMNLPRFIRQSDEWILQATVVNLTTNKADTRVKFQLINPLTEQPIAGLQLEEQNVSIDANGQQTLSWKIPSLPGIDLVICRVEAASAHYSDGEQRYLPVLSDRILVTESFPFTTEENKATEVRLSSLPEDAEVKQVSLEFTANPSWSALQALPLLSLPESRNLIDLLGAWYSNAVSLQLLNTNPVIKKVIQQINSLDLTEAAWVSQLEKNPDLKMILLKETPWLLEANDQTQQQRELIRLLNEEQLRTNAQKMLDELSNLQLPSGGFAWMAGMPESQYLSQLTAEKLLLMSAGSFQQEELNRMLNQTMNYLDAVFVRDFEQLKQLDKNYREHKTIQTLQLHYMTLRAVIPFTIHAEDVKEARQYYHEQIGKYRNSFSLFEKALAAQYFHRTGQTELTQQMLRSLNEQSVKDPLKGMHWPRLKASWHWNERPLSIHTRILEAFNEVQSTGAKQEIEAMKVWLLQQKRTTHWDNRLTTLEAVMALLTTGQPLLNKVSERTFKIGFGESNQLKTLKPTSTAIPGSGYYRENLPLNTSAVVADPVKGTMGSGAVYRQILQPMDHLKSTGRELTVERQYYLQTIEGKEVSLQELHTSSALQTGDKIVSRLVIKAAHDFEFVVLRDTKAAALESLAPLSEMKYRDGLLFYRSPGDVSTNYYFHYLPQGSYVLEEIYILTHTGNFSSGVAQIQSLYAPEYTGNSSGTRLNSSKDTK